MTNEELHQKIRTEGDPGDKLIMQLWEHNKGTIIKIIKATGSRHEIEDLLQECWFGFDKAVRTYNPGKGYSFSTHVKLIVHSHLVGYLFTNEKSVKISGWTARKVLYYNRFTRDYYHNCGEYPTDETIMSALKISEYQLNSIRKAIQHNKTESLDKNVYDDNTETLADQLITEDNSAENTAVENVFIQERRAAVLKAVNSLRKRQREAVLLNHYAGLTCSQIAEIKGLSRNSVKSYLLKGQRNIKKRYGRELSQFIDLRTTYTKGIQGTGTGTFRRTGTSATERTALWEIEKETEKRQYLADLYSVQKAKNV